jgi:hypothetical protein
MEIVEIDVDVIITIDPSRERELPNVDKMDKDKMTRQDGQDEENLSPEHHDIRQQVRTFCTFREF